MEELIKYFEGLEARIVAQDERIAALEAEVAELKNRPLPEPQVVEKVVGKIVERPVEVIKEVIVEKPAEVVVEEPVVAEPAPKQEPKPEPKEVASPNAALYGKAVSDIRQAISLGDRFLYQRELFGQNAELMQHTLSELDALTSYEEALSYINTHFQWEQDSNTYQQFLVTLHRRFG